MRYNGIVESTHIITLHYTVNIFLTLKYLCFQNIMKFWLEKGVAGLRINSINYLMEIDKDSFGGHYPDEPRTGKPKLGPDDYNYLEHVYTKDQEETFDIVSQFRDVFDAISIRDNITR